MSRRTGLRTIRETAYALCRLITLFTPVIRRVYADVGPLIIALDAANLACEALVSEADNYLPTGV